MISDLLLKIIEVQKLNSVELNIKQDRTLIIKYGRETEELKFIILKSPNDKETSMLNKNTYDVVLSDNINNAQAKKIADKGLAYFDACGNAEFVINGKRHIYRGEKASTKPIYTPNDFLTPKNEKALSIIYVLLTMKMPLKARDISLKAGVSLGLVGRICKSLIDENFLISSSDGYILNKVKSPSLADAWKQETIKQIKAFPSKKFITFNSPKEIKQQAAKYNLLPLNNQQYEKEPDDKATFLSIAPNLAKIGKNLSLLETKEKGDIEIIYFPYVFWFSRPEFIQLLNSIQ